MTYAEALALAAVALALVIGFLAGALWQSRMHIADLRSHAKWTDDYTREVAKLLDDIALALPRGEDRQ